MRKNVLFLVLAATALLFASCSKNMMGLDSSHFKSSSDPLEAHQGLVNSTVTATFPQKYFNKKAVVTVTPVLKHENGETLGQPVVFQGEKILDNNVAIPYAFGGTHTIYSQFEYVPEMAQSEMFLKFDVTQRAKAYTLPAVKVADGVIATSQLVSVSPSELQPALAPDNFQRITQEHTDADILFLIQQTLLRNTELQKENIIDFENKLQEARDAQNKEIASLQVLGYASPDGPLALNTNLAERRQKVTADYVNKELKKLKANVNIDSKFTAEDWDGFQKLMEASNIQDKELILRVLSMYQDPEQREREIKNLSGAFTAIADDILPQLRRARLKLEVDVIGKSDAEIIALATSNPKELTANELLYAGTLASTNRDQVSIYEQYIQQFGNDVRGYNNLGMMKYYNDDLKGAEALFVKALEKDASNSDANYNMGLVQLAYGKVADAQAYFGKSVGTVGDVNAALGTSYVMAGDYAKAMSSMREVNSNNAALAQILNNDYNAARATLGAVKMPDAMTAYLSAILAARTNDRDAVYNNLAKAIAMDKTLAKKAAKDLEFGKYFADAAFKAVVM